MPNQLRPLTVLLLLVASCVAGRAEIKLVVERNDNDSADSSFKFKSVPSPARHDAASTAAFTVIDGVLERSSGGVKALNDGRTPSEEDEPGANFFFRAGTDGGRLRVDLGRVIAIKQINSYSWHPANRGPQVYQLYASDGSATVFNPEPKRGVDPEGCGWKPIAKVDTRPKTGEAGGQYGVSVSGGAGVLGEYRYLLFDISKTEDADPFGNTFYSEIDVIDRDAPPEATDNTPPPGKDTLEAGGGKYKFTVDTSDTPDLTAWAREKLEPVIVEWYPKLVAMLPSDGYEAPRKFSVRFSDTMDGVAATGGTRVSCAAKWYRDNLQGEALGSVVHELVHVIQQYGNAGRTNPNPTRSPGWLVEGIPDYIRWYHFEATSAGAEISGRGFARAKYNRSYRVTANFLNFVVERYDKNLIAELNAAMREGRYTPDIWKEKTGKSVTDLDTEWKAALAKKLGIKPGPPGPAATNAPAKP